MILCLLRRVKTILLNGPNSECVVSQGSPRTSLLLVLLLALWRLSILGVILQPPPILHRIVPKGSAHLLIKLL